MDQSRAELIAAKALEYVAGRAELLERFMAISGLDPSQLRESIRDPDIHAGALTFLLDHEPDAAAFCEIANLDPGLADRARLRLARDSDDHPRSGRQ